MKHAMKLALLLGTAAILAGTGLAFAQIDGPTPPDGPMQGLMHGHSRMGGHFLTEFDSNHDGKVTRDEVNKVVGQRFAAAAHGGGAITAEQFAGMHTGSLGKHVAEMFHRVDWNGDGKLSLEEYTAPQRAHFEMMDRDGSGTVSCRSQTNTPAGDGAPPPDMGPHHGDRGPGHGRHGHGRGFGGFGAGKLCADADANKDGKVTRAEFDQSVAKRFAAITHGASFMTGDQFGGEIAARFREMNAKMFQRLDADHDGKLTFAEFAAPTLKMFAHRDKNNDGVVMKDELSTRGNHGNWHKGSRN